MRGLSDESTWCWGSNSNARSEKAPSPPHSFFRAGVSRRLPRPPLLDRFAGRRPDRPPGSPGPPGSCFARRRFATEVSWRVEPWRRGPCHLHRGDCASCEYKSCEQASSTTTSLASRAPASRWRHQHFDLGPVPGRQQRGTPCSCRAQMHTAGEVEDAAPSRRSGSGQVNLILRAPRAARRSSSPIHASLRRI